MELAHFQCAHILRFHRRGGVLSAFGPSARFQLPSATRSILRGHVLPPVASLAAGEDQHGQLNQSRRASIDRAQLPARLTCCTATRDGLGDACLAAGARLAAGACASGNSGGVGPASAVRPSVGGGPRTDADTIAGAGTGAAAVVTVDQPATAVTGFSAAAGLFFGITAGGAPFLAALARMALGKQRPSSLRPWPEGHGLPQARS